MNFYIYGLIGVCVLLVVGLTFWVRHRRAEKVWRAKEAARYERQRSALRTWISDITNAKTAEEVANVDDSVLRKLGLDDWWAIPNDLRTDEWKKANKRLEQARVAIRLQRVAEDKRLDMLIGLLGYRRTIPTQFGVTKKAVVAEINERIDTMRSAVDVDKPETVFAFNDLRHAHPWSEYRSDGVKAPTCPEGWNGMVVRCYKAPEFTVFDGYRSNPSYGIVSLLAAKAVNSRNPVIGKLVMAYAAMPNRGYGGRGNQPHPYRVEIGDQLYADVVTMVHDFHVREGLFLKQRAESP